MPSHVPTPVAAAIGLVPTVLDGVRRLPSKSLSLPVMALSTALGGLGTARREYDALAMRGERLIAQLRGTSFDKVEDRFEDALRGTPLATPYDKVEDALEGAGETVVSLVSAAPSALRKAGEVTADTADAVATAAEEVAGQVAGAAGQVADPAGQADDEVPADEESKGAPTPKATQPDSTRIDTAAAPGVVETVERLSATIGGNVVDHGELPLPDYDHLTLGSLRGRMRSLDLPQLVVVRDYEKAHADRLPIVTMLDNRIAKLASDPTAPLSSGGNRPAGTTATKRGSKVSQATAAPVSVTASPDVAFGGLGGPGASHPT